MGERPASTAVPMALRNTVVPPRGRRSLFRPMRVDCPAASTMPAMGASPVMDASRLLPQVHRRAARADGEHLGDDADCYLLRAVGSDVEPDGRVEPRGSCDPDFLQDLLPARAWTEEADVAERLFEERFEPGLVVRERVGLHDRGVPRRKPQARDTVLGTA